MYKFGQHLEVSRGFYNHHGIYIGDNKIIHYSAPPNSNSDGVGVFQVLGQDSQTNTIHITEISNFERQGKPEEIIYSRDSVYPPLKVVARANNRLGENGYNLWGNNCEHFATWCKIACAESAQINFWKSTLTGGVSGALLGRFVGPAGFLVAGGVGAVAGAVKAWLSKKNRLLPVYQEFLDYSTELYFNCRKKHPLGKSFRHTSQLDDKKEFLIPNGMPDKMAIFSYDGSWLFGTRNDWFITERAIVWPKQNLYLHFHEVEKIYSSFGSLVIKDTSGIKSKLPTKFVNSRSLAKFLNAAVAMTPLCEKDMKVSIFSIIKETLRLFIGGIILSLLTGVIFPPAAPIIFSIILIVIIVNPFLDKNELYTEKS